MLVLFSGVARPAMISSTLVASLTRSRSSLVSFPKAFLMSVGSFRRNSSLKTIFPARWSGGSSLSMLAAMAVAEPSPRGEKSRKLDASCVSDGPYVVMTRSLNRM